MRPKLLYLSPKVPQFAGHGTAMRAGLHLRVLGEMFDVHLVVTSEEKGVSVADVPEEIRKSCRSTSVHPADGHMDRFQAFFRSRVNRQAQMLGRALHPYPYDIRLYNWATRHRIAESLRGIEFDVIHAFRMHMAPLALTLARQNGTRRPRLILDLDVYESEAAKRHASMTRAAAGFQWHWLHRLDAAKYAFWEWRYLRRFDQLWVCSEDDRSAMARRYRAANIHTVRNGFAVPSAPLAATDPDIFTFLFVGTMSYFANEEGILFFCREVLPLLRARATAPFRVVVVGRGPSAEVQKLEQIPEVTVTGAVPDVGDYYRDAQAVIVPLRLGGGTRIKILEAFSYGVPVIATSIGAAGIEARNDVEILLADLPDEFAKQCAAVMANARFRQEIARNAFNLAVSRYSFHAIRGIIHDRLAPAGPELAPLGN